MAPTSKIILCRHSQAEHNVDLDYSIPDAPLTPLGKKQSAALAPQIPDLQKSVDLIVTSALKRTLQSTKLGWGPAVERLGIKHVICLPQAQECNEHPCDTGSSRQDLEALDEFKDFNFELLTDDWNSKKGFYAPDAESLANRARWVRQFLRDRPEAEIVLVAHGDFLRRITCTAEGPSTYQWRNAEVRVFEFDPKTVEGPDCFLYQREIVAAAGGYAQTSTEMDILEEHLR
ncbi:hypothetical protein HWV62_44181 [Athelia sp. TMB]|nr:hypothetical protein HWV62_44181 [Athelia sp. TMB]